MELEEIRKHLDRLDDAIVTLIAERLSYSRHVSKAKEESGQDLFQPQREKLIIEKVKKLASKHGLREELTQEIFEKIIKESLEIQRGK